MNKDYRAELDEAFDRMEKNAVKAITGEMSSKDYHEPILSDKARVKEFDGYMESLSDDEKLEFCDYVESRYQKLEKHFNKQHDLLQDGLKKLVEFADQCKSELDEEERLIKKKRQKKI